MILGVGTDMVEISRVEKACERGAFFLHSFTEGERAHVAQYSSGERAHVARYSSGECRMPGMGKMRETPTDGTGEGLMADEPVDIGESARSTESANRCMTTLAGDFAVKEAVAKALGTGFRGFGPGDIGVLRDGLGKPYVELAGGAKARLEEIGATAVHVSITNTKEYAFAFAVVER